MNNYNDRYFAETEKSQIYREIDLECGRRKEEARVCLSRAIIANDYLWEIARTYAKQRNDGKNKEIKINKKSYPDLPRETVRDDVKVSLYYTHVERRLLEIASQNKKPWNKKVREPLEEIIETRNKLADANEGLVYQILQNKLGRRFRSEFREDIIQEMKFGMLDAAHKYDHKFEVRFSSYAQWYINAYRKQMLKEILGLKKDRNGKKVMAFSLDDYIYDGRDGNAKVRHIDVTPDNNSLSFVSEMMSEEVIDKFLDLCKKSLPERSYKMILQRIKGHNFRQIGSRFKITRERSRQIVHREAEDLFNVNKETDIIRSLLYG